MGHHRTFQKNDQEFNLHTKQGVWNICLETQLAKSPDTNVSDLSFLERCKQDSGVWVQRRPLMGWLLRYFRLFEISNQGRLIVAFDFTGVLK